MNRILKFALLVGIFLLVILGRMAFYQYKYIEESASNTGIEKVKAYERVILYHFPFSPYTDKALKGLLSECESFKENNEKLYCYETLRSSLIQIGSFYQPYKDVIEQIKPKIAQLRTFEMIAWKYNGLLIKDFEKIYNEQLRLLNFKTAPSMFWSVMVVFSFIGWSASLILIILKGFTTPVNKKYFLTGLLGFLLLFTIWLIGLWIV